MEINDININTIHLFRMTHINNIPHILQHGITHKNSKNANNDYIKIGDSSLISTREKKEVAVTNGSNVTIKKIVLGNFIPFYFGVRMPMLYVVQHGGNFTTQTPASDIIYLVCSLDKILRLDVEFYFTDGHATDNLTTFYDKSYINQLNSILDWNAIKSQYWGGEDNLEIKRKKQAEFLVKDDLPPDVILKYLCYDDKARKRLLNFSIQENMIEINKDAYY